MAKAFAGENGEAKPLDSPTISDAATRQGIILGTAAYMSPEQARGKAVDRRADIWAFGVVLFEMLTGRTLFAGEDITSTLARVLERQPDYSALTPNLHPRIRLLLERCLEKEAKNRYSSISDARVDIQKVMTDPSGVFAQPSLESSATQRRVLPWTLAVVVLVLAAVIIALLLHQRPPSEPREILQFSYELPEGVLADNLSDIIISPDGKKIAFATAAGIYLRSVTEMEFRLITETNDNPGLIFFSEDGHWVGYWSSTERKMKRIAVTGGAPLILCDTGPQVLTAAWGPNDTVLFSQLPTGLMQVSAKGGTPKPLISYDPAKVAATGFPVAAEFLPDGKTILYTGAMSVSPIKAKIFLYSVESGERKELFEGLFGRYLPTGHIVYALGKLDSADLFAVAFDPASLKVIGSPVSMLTKIVMPAAISASGTMAYRTPSQGVSGNGAGAGNVVNPPRTLFWVDRKGQETVIEMPPGHYRYPKISPDGTRLALTNAATVDENVWVWDIARGIPSRLTFSKGRDWTPIWSPDSSRIAFMSSGGKVIEKAGTPYAIFMKAADGSGEEELLLAGTEGVVVPGCWSKEGATLLYTRFIGDGMTNQDIEAVSLDDNRSTKAILQENYVEIQPRLSPDGHWLAYTSQESGKNEIYVSPFPDVEKGKWQVSNDGGSAPLWAPDGRELFYLIGGIDGVMSVRVETEPVFKHEKPTLLFRGSYAGGISDGVPWDIHPDGKRFLMIKESAASTEESSTNSQAKQEPVRINIVVNWDEELKERVPVK